MFSRPVPRIYRRVARRFSNENANGPRTEESRCRAGLRALADIRRFPKLIARSIDRKLGRNGSRTGIIISTAGNLFAGRAIRYVARPLIPTALRARGTGLLEINSVSQSSNAKFALFTLRRASFA